MLNDKEIKELAFDQDYWSDDESYGFIDGYKKAQNQQRELLISFMEYVQEHQAIAFIDKKELAEGYIKKIYEES
tara:strand:+ start:1561 stop:1782 length:222 start_codon:yes stop_codon:yes gene_type:complete